MPPKKSTSTRGTKRSSGLGQPTLSFSQRKPGAGDGKKATSKKTSSSEDVLPSTPLAVGVGAENENEPVDITLDDEPQAQAQAEAKGLNPRSKEWAGVYRDAKVAMGNMDPIHAGPESHNQVHHILRVFDMTSKYGPSVGITRLQRWERAKKWGLNPPDEIHSILTTKEGRDDASYRENVLHTWL